jgi:hypothetical protein
MTTAQTPRIGSRMLQALHLLALEENGTMKGKARLAKAVGPRGSARYGDEVVMRCVQAGLIALSGDPESHQGYTLTTTEKGLSAII